MQKLDTGRPRSYTDLSSRGALALQLASLPTRPDTKAPKLRPGTRYADLPNTTEPRYAGPSRSR
jgi:hypothetical protein